MACKIVHNTTICRKSVVIQVDYNNAHLYTSQTTISIFYKYSIIKV